MFNDCSFFIHEFDRKVFPSRYVPLKLRQFADTTILILILIFLNVLLITIIVTLIKISLLPSLEYLYRANDFWCKINTLSNIDLKKIQDIIEKNLLNLDFELFIDRHSSWMDIRFRRFSGVSCIV